MTVPHSKKKLSEIEPREKCSTVEKISPRDPELIVRF
jgi:hypothetical protein